MTITQIRDAEIGKPRTLRGTSIFPIFTDPTTCADFEIATDQLEIGELASASVPELSVHNPTKKPVIISAGKILAGG
ncbi:MAG: ARPP-1 family domain-containing protein, partial [Acidimicrobiaceae bacterium]